MARANYIYIVYNKKFATVTGAFTEKYEMLNAIEGCKDQVFVHRFHDGEIGYAPVEVEVDNSKSPSKIISTQ